MTDATATRPATTGPTATGPVTASPGTTDATPTRPVTTAELSPPETEQPSAVSAPTRFVFLDTEATGLDEVRHELTEIAWIVRLEDGREVERQYFPTHTLDAADEAALELTGYRERIADQPRTPMAQWLPQFLEDARGAVIVGAVPDFDVRHLLKSCRKLGLAPTWDHHLVDVGTLALPLIAPGPETPRSLARTCEALGIPHDPDQAHGALYDAHQVRLVFDSVWSLVDDLRATGKPLPPPVARPRRTTEPDPGSTKPTGGGPPGTDPARPRPTGGSAPGADSGSTRPTGGGPPGSLE